MKPSNWIVFGVALGLMAATAGFLQDFRGRHLLGPPGVKVGAVPIFDENGRLAAAQSIVLPTNISGMATRNGFVTTSELGALPKDTTFGRRFYSIPGTDFDAQLTVVLMGTDHTSIHQPQYCLYARNWSVTNTERINLHMVKPYVYDIPAIKLTATQTLPDSGRVVDGIYIYWFVSGDKITAEEGSRLWSMWKTMLSKGEMERWAYISYFAACLPGQETATFGHLEKFIEASAPEFQLVTGKPSGQSSLMVDPK